MDQLFTPSTILTLILFGIILVLVIATEVNITRQWKKWLLYKTKELELKEYDIDMHLQVTDDIEVRLDKIIESCFQEYSIMNLIYKTEWYIKEEEEVQISKDICNLVSLRISPVMMKQLSLYYNEEAIMDIIAKRVYFKVTKFVIEHNKNTNL